MANNYSIRADQVAKMQMANNFKDMCIWTIKFATSPICVHCTTNTHTHTRCEKCIMECIHHLLNVIPKNFGFNNRKILYMYCDYVMSGINVQLCRNF